ncbi:MAG: PIN domain protein [Candidatus Omnitrophica bacterium]|nr:PIN domain protein [Candidatus Omnitrophota bacterium]
MKIPKVYIDTSVIGGCFDEEFKDWSNLLMDNFRMGYFKPVVSQTVAFEIRKAPEQVRRKYEQLVGEYEAPVLTIDEDCEKLVKAYQRHKILNNQFIDDMTHIAIATVNEIDILVSWNFRHILRYNMVSQFNSVNIDEGYKPLAIHSPREVAYEKKI